MLFNDVMLLYDVLLCSSVNVIVLSRRNILLLLLLLSFLIVLSFYELDEF